jgi:amidophosphoribosyltransferase
MKIDKPEEACGIIGVVAPGKSVSRITFNGLNALQHRGQESAGIAVFDFNFFKLHKNMGLVLDVFADDILAQLCGHIAIGHTRYSTMGDSKLNNSQPFAINTRLGTIALAHNGNIVNVIELRDYLIEKGLSLSSSSDSEIILSLIAERIDDGYTLEDASLWSLSKCKGAYSLVIGSKDRLIVAKDPNGIRPLCLGRGKSGEVVVASESCALDSIDAKYIRELNPGELLDINIRGNIKSSRISAESKNNLCIFELIYFSRVDSFLYGSSLYTYRYKMGLELAKTAPVKADIVVPVPDSGLCAALGYSYGSCIPLAQGLVKNQFAKRTFIQPNYQSREVAIALKLNPVRDVVSGKTVVIVDDSIVRGTTCKKIIEMLKTSGAKDIHLRIASPPVKYSCFYGIDTDNTEQLIAASLSEEDISYELGASTLKYLNYKSMLGACDVNSNNDFCTACFTGSYPVCLPYKGSVHKMILEK